MDTKLSQAKCPENSSEFRQQSAEKELQIMKLQDAHMIWGLFANILKRDTVPEQFAPQKLLKWIRKEGNACHSKSERKP